ncbi:YcaO-like family protein [Actinospica durhamensis]|uniref:YcaO-like family protein n=1 Tax=Actinospica durhamensis TaxID=1508375 RepID=A0A941ETC9_9ACTN|nr:YcaO-like family protein [Actinospica durhamensis]MBR7836077.1 YcaO-like family protein [Actinospica durhamensis]
MSLEYLLSPFGVVSGLLTDPPLPGLPGYRHVIGMAGAGIPFGANGMTSIVGAGRTYRDPASARLIALAETAERYAGLSGTRVPMVWSTAADLPGRHLDLRRLPRCTPEEYAHPACPVVPFDPAAPIRWVSGTDLATGEATWVPAVLACYQIPEQSDAERFSYRISTGHAVHTDAENALFGALCEMVERDAIALIWLQRLTPPELPADRHGDLTRELIDWAARRHLRTWLFDATTDLGVPVVYCLQQAEHDASLHTVVGCGAAASLPEAAEKALLEAIGIRPGLRGTDLKSDPATFGSLTDGARYMAHPERAAAFDFLFAGPDGRLITGVEPLAFDRDPQARLGRLIAVFAERGMEAIGLDMTTSELEAAGLTAVSVVVPDLQPLTMLRHAQFRAHPRLYAAPVAMGCAPLPPEELNPWPQPFA